MGDHLTELRELAASYVDGDEPVLDVAKVTYGGKVNLEQTPHGFAALGAPDTVIAGEQLANRSGQTPAVDFPAARQMALVLTARRILVWSTGGLRGKPKNFIGEVPLAAVEAVGVEDARSGTRLQIKLRSGWEVNLDAGTEAGDAFGERLRELVRR